MSARVPRRLPDAASRVIDGAAVVIQTRQAEVSMLNEVGTLLWGAIDGARTEEDLVRLVTEEFDVGVEEAARDVRAFLDDLAAASLVELT